MKSKNSSKSSTHNIKDIIQNYIKMHPGSSYRDIKAVISIPESTLRYHLKDLEKHGHLRLHEERRVYYSSESVDKGSLSDKQQKLLYAIQNNDGITINELQLKTKIKKATIRHNLMLIAKMDLVASDNSEKSIMYYYVPPEELEHRKMLRLISKFLDDKIDEESYWVLKSAVKAPS